MKPEEYRNIIQDAIAKEVESYVFYRSIFEKVKDASLKSTFKESRGRGDEAPRVPRGTPREAPQGSPLR